MPAVFQIGSEQYTRTIVTVVGSNSVSPYTGLTGYVTHGYVTVEGAAVRYRLDGVTAHSATGHLANTGDVIVLHGANVLADFRVISPAPSATLMASLGHG